VWLGRHVILCSKVKDIYFWTMWPVTIQFEQNASWFLPWYKITSQSVHEHYCCHVRTGFIHRHSETRCHFFFLFFFFFFFFFYAVRWHETPLCTTAGNQSDSSTILP
jgi:hypothetical protein